MKLSAFHDGRPFALLGPGFTGGGFVLVRALAPVREDATDAAVLFVPYTGLDVSIRAFSGEVVRFDSLELDVAPVQVNVEPERTEFAEAVETIRARIAAGDVYQVNLTQRCALGEVDARALVSRFCARAVPRFLAWLRLPGGAELVSASPECLFALDSTRIRVEPMKGTAPADEAEALEASGKDRAELAMITDLMRNDLTPLCEPRSVQVTAARKLLRLPYAHQTVSEVEGVLRPDVKLTDVLRGLHPAGSITGAPKRAAVEQIALLETSPRGPYCGTLVWRDGPRATASVLIRTAFRERGGWRYGVGGGITWRSTPQGEWDELQTKLGALR